MQLDPNQAEQIIWMSWKPSYILFAVDLPFLVQKFLQHIRLYTRKMLLFTH